LEYLKEAVKYIEFVGRAKNYGKKVEEARKAKEDKLLQQERTKDRAIKGVEARVVKDIIENSPRQMLKFETKVNMMLYEEGDKAAEELRNTEKTIEEKKKYIKDLRRLQKNMVHQVNKEREEAKRKQKYEEDANYINYQRELVIIY
jgi:hypothetical protein